VTVAPLAAYVIGAVSALTVPLRLRGSGIARLIRGVPPLGRERGDPTNALRAAHRMLRILARARLPWWRNTCLYRAVAECLVLRYYGIPSRVRLGVARPGDESPIHAHAWSLRGNDSLAEAPNSLVVLR